MSIGLLRVNFIIIVVVVAIAVADSYISQTDYLHEIPEENNGGCHECGCDSLIDLVSNLLVSLRLFLSRAQLLI